MEEDTSEGSRSKRSIRERCCSWGPGWKTLTWFAVMFGYLLLGGLVFTLAERQNEIDAVSALTAEREELQQLLEEGRGAAIASLAANNCNAATRDAARETIERVINISFSLALASQQLQAETSPLWTYSPSVFFSATVITTIGYGNTAPVTVVGRVLFIFYAILGIPICLIFLTLVGEYISQYINSVTEYVAKRTKARTAKHKTTVQGVTVIILFIVGLILFIFLPSVIFYAIEGWTYGEAVYYCFVTLTTVGFGDFVPAQASGTEIHAFYRICSAAWILVGLAWVALLVAKVQSTLEKVGPHIASQIRQRKEKRKQQKSQLRSSELVSTEMA